MSQGKLNFLCQRYVYILKLARENQVSVTKLILLNLVCTLDNIPINMKQCVVILFFWGSLRVRLGMNLIYTVDSRLFEPPRGKGDKNLVRITGSSNN